MEMDNNSVNLKTTIGHNTLSKISFNDEEVYFSYYDKDSSPWGLIDFLNRYLSKMPLITSISLHQEPGEFCFVIYNNKLYYFDDYNKGGFNFKYPKLLKNGISYLSENALDNIQEFENFIDNETKEIKCSIKEFAKNIYKEFNKNKFSWAEEADNLSNDFFNALDILGKLIS